MRGGVIPSSGRLFSRRNHVSSPDRRRPVRSDLDQRLGADRQWQRRCGCDRPCGARESGDRRARTRGFSGDRLLDCEAREKGIAAFKKLYEADKKRAIAALQRRFDEIPSPKGGYFPILAAVKVKDKAFIPMLKKLAEAQKENVMGTTWAPEAISGIETGKCTRTPPVPSNLREICE
jgi:hypothetical protein